MSMDTTTHDDAQVVDPGVQEPGRKPLRADAQRNYDKIIETARQMFREKNADVSMDAIAKRAGVGPGTLYRHFPTREALVEAAYRSELARLCDGVDGLLQDGPPDVALREWMDRFVDYMTTKRGMADALRAVIASGGNPFAESRDRLLGAIGPLLEAGAAAGVLRGDVLAGDVLAGLSGISLAAGDPAQREQAGRLLDLLVDGLRYRP
jgi:AcrR family transcriptional regulator